jgi:hypothetical protein
LFPKPCIGYIEASAADLKGEKEEREKKEKKNAREAGSKREKGKTQRAGVHLFDCESLHRNKVTEKKKEGADETKRGEKGRERETKNREEKQKRGLSFIRGLLEDLD